MNTFDTIDETYVQKNGVQALANRPNQPSQYGQGGLNAAQLKAHFDHLATHIINKYNALVAALADPALAASYIAWEKDGESVTSLADFFASVSDGELAKRLKVIVGKDNYTLATLLNTLDGEIDTLLIKIANGALAKEMKVITTDLDEIDADSVVGHLVSILSDIASLKTSINNLITAIASVQTDYLSKSVTTEQELAGNIKTPQISATNAVIGNINLSGGITSTNKKAQSKFGQLDADGITATSGVFTKVTATETVTTKNLVVTGTTTSVSYESIVTPSSFVITNSNGFPFETSGFVINKGDGTCYGICYDVESDCVKIGLGKINEDGEFQFYEGQAIPLAARSGAFADGDIPLWDATKNAFVSSGTKLDALAARSGSFEAGEVPVWDADKNAFKPGGIKLITEYDYEITEPSQFTTDNLATMSGAVLVKCPLRIDDYYEPTTVTIPTTIKVLNLNGNAININLAGHKGCRLMNAYFEASGGDHYEYDAYVDNFGSVEFCTGAGSYCNCDRIAHSSIWTATDCTFITDVKTAVSEYQDTVFLRCTNITNVKVSDIYTDEFRGNVEFDSCSYISNVSFAGENEDVIKYINCKHVDALTCYGYKGYEDEYGNTSGAAYGVPYIDAHGRVTFLSSAEGGSYGS